MPSKRFKMGHRRSAGSDEEPRPSPEAKRSINAPSSADHDLEIPTNEDIGDPETLLRVYGMQLSQTTCGICKVPVLLGQQTVLECAEKLLHFDASGYIPCHSCQATTCIGCGMMPRTRRSGDRGPCCQNARLFCIWIWLCALDNSQLRTEQTKYTSSDQPSIADGEPPGRPGFVSQRKTNGIGYGGNNGYGSNVVNYGGENLPPTLPASSLHAKVRAERAYSKRVSTPSQARELILLFRMFEALKALLPSPVRSTAFDQDPPPILTVMLQKSQVLEKIACLLRTDSLDDIMAKFELYSSLLDVMSMLIHNPRLIKLTIQPRVLWPVDLGVLNSTLPIRTQTAGQQRNEEVMPLGQLLDKLCRTTRKVQQRAHLVKDDFNDHHGQQLLHLCTRVDQVHRILEQAAKTYGFRLESSGAPISHATTSQAQEMAQWHLENCVDVVEDSMFQLDFHFVKERNRKDQPAKGRMKRLVTEIATLQSSLPEGIYVRYANSRPDLMKILIIGPRDTPYEQGLFEFDLVCPLDYPNSPPKMHFRTTGKGRASFNPNLYPDGKVCLSLLGTWNGPAWMPNESTLLQLLVSIQAMIFCAEPWYNEPGRESRDMEDQSRRFNVEVQSLTILYALNDYLRQARAHKTKSNEHRYWQDVIERHFHAYGTEILGKLREWEKKALELPERLDRRYAMAPIPSIPPQAFDLAQTSSPASSIPPHDTLIPTFPPPTSTPTLLSSVSQASWAAIPSSSFQATWSMWAPHPHFLVAGVGSPAKFSVGMKLAELANVIGSPLVIPLPGGKTFKADPMVPPQFVELLEQVAEKTGVPLVVPTGGTYIPPKLDADLDHSFYQALLSKLPSSMPHILDAVFAYTPQPPSQLGQLTITTPKPKSYAEVAATTQTQIKKAQETVTKSKTFFGKTEAMFKEISGAVKQASTKIKAPQEGTAPTVSSLSGGLSQQIPHNPVPSLGAFASIPGPTIPAELLVDSNPELLADWLTAAIAQLDSSKSSFPPSHPVFGVITGKQETLISEANKNAAGKVFALSDFASDFGLTDSELEDDIPVYVPSRGKLGLKKEVEEYEKALKDFLRDE